MIDLDFEHNKKLSTQDIYNIISHSIEVADEDGMLNSFIFQRALYVFAAATLFEDQTEDILMNIPQFPQLWDDLVEKNVIDELKANYPRELTELCAIGEAWFSEYDAHVHSSYAIVTAISNIVQNLTSNFQNQVDNISKDGNIKQLIETASHWGMDNDNPSQAALHESLMH